MNITNVTKQTIKSVSDLLTWAEHQERLSQTSAPRLFRGQAEEFQNLEPGFARAAKYGNEPVNYQAVMLLEKQLLQGFRSHYAQIRDLTPEMPKSDDLMDKSSLEVLSLMQHYEVPTRLLDWSESIWVATYFACASSPGKNAELWFFDESLLDVTPDEVPISHVQNKVNQAVGAALPEYHEKWGMPYFAVIEPMYSSRLRAQQGKLTASAHAQVAHQAPLWRLATQRHGFENSGDSFGRYVIQAEAKPKILSYLNQFQNISAKTLFPDIAGLQRYLKWEFDALHSLLISG